MRFFAYASFFWYFVLSSMIAFFCSSTDRIPPFLTLAVSSWTLASWSVSSFDNTWILLAIDSSSSVKSFGFVEIDKVASFCWSFSFRVILASMSFYKLLYRLILSL